MPLKYSRRKTDVFSKRSRTAIVLPRTFILQQNRFISGVISLIKVVLHKLWICLITFHPSSMTTTIVLVDFLIKNAGPSG